jgi:UDP-2-acetamido-2-deoxy-ribo-hexuluronate aminotransferase
MIKIQMVDLKGQHNKIAIEINDAIQNVLNSTAFINGPQVKSFAQNLAQHNRVEHVIPCANGTDALQIALMSLDLEPDDEIILPAFTYISTIEVTRLLNLKPVLIDVDPLTFNLDPSKIEEAITPRTKVIIPVHLFGQCADMTGILEIAQKYNLVIIEDTAQALGAEFSNHNGLTQKAGTIGTIGTTSFFPSKNLGCYGDGGAIFTNDESLYLKMNMIANHGQSKKYYHEVIGVNSRLDTIQAAILNVKLNYLDQYNTTRQVVADFYDNALSDIQELIVPTRNLNSTHIFNQYTLIVKNGQRDELGKYLNNNDIPFMIYYPLPIHIQKAFSNLGYKAGDFPIAESLCKSVISLPMHTELYSEQQQFIVKTVKDFFSN